MDRFIVEILNFFPGLYGAKGGLGHNGYEHELFRCRSVVISVNCWDVM